MLLSILTLLLLLLLLSDDALAGKKSTVQNDMPAWFLTPPAGCGGGSAVFDPTMREIAKVEADTNARADLTRQVESQVSSVVKTAYSKSTTDGSTQSSSSAQSVAKTSTEMALLGARTMASEVKGGSLYLMVCIEPGSLVKSFEEMAYLDDAMRTALVQGTRDSFGKQSEQLAALGLGR